MLVYEDVMEKVDYQYAALKVGDRARYMAPEMLPRIGSDQIRALAKVLVQEINKALAEQKRRD